MKINTIVKLAIVSAIYIALTIAFGSISYGPIQFRIAEMLVLLCFYKKEYCYSLVIGCLLANLFSFELGWYDVLFGTLHTTVSVFVISKTKNLFIASLIPTIFIIIVAIELSFVLELPILLTWLEVAIGEFIVVSVFGYTLFKILSKREDFMSLINIGN